MTSGGKILNKVSFFGCTFIFLRSCIRNNSNICFCNIDFHLCTLDLFQLVLGILWSFTDYYVVTLSVCVLIWIGLYFKGMYS